MHLGLAIAIGRVDVSAPPGTFDFSGGALPAGTTFTRSSAASDFDKNGVMKTYGNDVPAYGYNPATLAFKGLLIEPASTALALQSRNFTSGAWTAVSISRTTGQASAKFGDNGATLLTSNSGGTDRIEQTGIPTTIGNTYTVEAIFYMGSGTSIRLRADNNSLTYQVSFNMDTMIATATTGGGFGNVSNIQFYSIGGGEYYGSFDFVPTGGTSSTMRVYPSALTSVGLDAIGFKNTPSGSYIDTTTQTVTRSAPVLTLTLPYASNNLTVTFDDNSTQAINGVTSPYVVNPSTINRPYIKLITTVSA
jgi:hypothetical protein